MITIELTEQQRRALQVEQDHPVDVVDPATQRRYVLLAREQYERVRALLERKARQEPPEASSGVPPGILRSQQAFWRDLPELLKDRKIYGRWVAYRGEERIGIARTEIELIRECNRRGLREDEYDLDVIEPHAHPPWEPEEIEAGGHEVDGVDDS